MKSREEVESKIKEILIELFELEEEELVPSARLYQDLDLDSIDAVNMVVKLQEITGKKVDPESFKLIRTVEDMNEAVFKLVNED